MPFQINYLNKNYLKTTLVNNCDNNNIIDIQNVSIVNKVKSTSTNNNNDPMMRNSIEDIAMCVFVKRVRMRGLQFVGIVGPCTIVVEVTS